MDNVTLLAFFIESEESLIRFYINAMPQRRNAAKKAP